METGIAASVLAFGLLVAVAIRLPMLIAIALTAVFALTHGVAHGLNCQRWPAHGAMPPVL